MKGLILGQYYATAKLLWMYYLVSAALGIFFSVFSSDNLVMTCILIVAFSISAPTDNLKHEAAAEWYKYAITLPVNRKDIVNSHYVYYLLTMCGGVIILVLISALNLILGQVTLLNAFSSITLAISFGLLLSLAYPFTYSVGAEKSNMIQIIVMLLIVGLFVTYNFITLIIGGTIFESGGDAIKHAVFEIPRQILFFIISIVLSSIGYMVGLNKFKKTNF